jgi:hypothetical protein
MAGGVKIYSQFGPHNWEKEFKKWLGTEAHSTDGISTWPSELGGVQKVAGGVKIYSQPGPQNWEKEFKKWLGTERIQVFTVASDSRVEKFKEASRLYQVIIISYEMVCKQPKFPKSSCGRRASAPTSQNKLFRLRWRLVCKLVCSIKRKPIAIQFAVFFKFRSPSGCKRSAILYRFGCLRTPARISKHSCTIYEWNTVHPAFLLVRNEHFCATPPSFG